MQNRVDVSNIDSSKLIAAASHNGNIGDHASLNTKSAVVLVEYGDFQCPACGQASSNVKTVTDKYKDDITFVFRNMPLTTIHPNALAAAAAAEAAGLQGKYWAMHDELYQQQNQWSSLGGAERSDQFATYAKSLGLDVNKFKQDMASSSVAQKINFDRAIAGKLGITSTPSFYVNGKRLSDDIQKDIVSGDGKKLDAFLSEKVKSST